MVRRNIQGLLTALLIVGVFAGSAQAATLGYDSSSNTYEVTDDGTATRWDLSSEWVGFNPTGRLTFEQWTSSWGNPGNLQVSTSRSRCDYGTNLSGTWMSAQQSVGSTNKASCRNWGTNSNDIDMSLGGGNDRVTTQISNNSTRLVHINLGSGDDSYTDNGVTAVSLSAGAGYDVIIAGSINDSINTVDGERDDISCGSGNDTVSVDRYDLPSTNCETVLVQ